MSENALTPIQAMRGTLTSMAPEFQAALPPQIPVEKFIRTTLTAIQMQPELLNADRRSLLGGCMKAAQDGLLCDGREAALVMFNSKSGKIVQYMPMVGGILKKIRNSGELASISAQVVYDKDHFDYELGDDERIVHKPFLGKDRGSPIAVYGIAKTKDGAIYREVMSVDEVEQVRKVSRASGNGPWVQWWGEMAKKTVIRRLAKRLPSSADVDSVLESDNEASGFVQIERIEPVNTTPPPSEQVGALSRLKASMAEAEDDDEVIDAETGEIQDATEEDADYAPNVDA